MKTYAFGFTTDSRDEVLMLWDFDDEHSALDHLLVLKKQNHASVRYLGQYDRVMALDVAKTKIQGFKM